MAQTTTSQHGNNQPAESVAIGPFQVDVPEGELTELRRRVKATKWPEREPVADPSQGVQLKACSSRRFRSSCAVGPPTTIGASV